MKLKTLIVMYMVIATVLACSKQNFTQAPSPECEGSDCTLNPDGTETYRETVTVPQINNKVDILFVVDNSGSMRDEQNHLAYRFNSFISSISNLDYRVAIATTDNESGSQEYKDGRLVRFRDGSYVTNLYWITKNTTNKEILFSGTIQRPESNCSYGCVSGDERGILTANRAAERYAGSSGFIRPDAMLHVIFIADEDERSNGGGFSGMPIEDRDKPQTLVNVLNALPVSGASRKRVQLHSIINIPGEAWNRDSYSQAGFSACVQRQITDTKKDEYDGCHYALASVLTGGVIGNIDDSNYSFVYGAIANSIHDTSLAQIDFRCVPTTVTITPVDGSPYPSSLSNPYVWTNPNRTNYITFNPRLQPGTSVRVSYTCPRKTT